MECGQSVPIRWCAVKSPHCRQYASVNSTLIASCSVGGDACQAQWPMAGKELHNPSRGKVARDMCRQDAADKRNWNEPVKGRSKESDAAAAMFAQGGAHCP
jgi:hypothetical protein